ncbi:hypothetical protein [Endozoicomonas montiporae]|nr:hypothetical protein [Endozoicomonas montiporae]
MAAYIKAEPYSYELVNSPNVELLTSVAPTNVDITINNKTKHDIPVYVDFGGLEKVPEQTPKPKTVYTISSGKETTYTLKKPSDGGYFIVYSASDHNFPIIAVNGASYGGPVNSLLNKVPCGVEHICTETYKPIINNDELELYVSLEDNH